MPYMKANDAVEKLKKEKGSAAPSTASSPAPAAKEEGKEEVKTEKEEEKSESDDKKAEADSDEKKEENSEEEKKDATEEKMEVEEKKDTEVKEETKEEEKESEVMQSVSIGLDCSHYFFLLVYAIKCMLIFGLKLPIRYPFREIWVSLRLNLRWILYESSFFFYLT